MLARSSAEYGSFNQQRSQQTVDELQQECKPKYSKIIKSDEDPKQNEPDEAEDEEVGSKQQTSSAYKLSDDNGEGKHIPIHNMIYTNEIKPVESISNEWSRQQYQQKFPFAPTGKLGFRICCHFPFFRICQLPFFTVAFVNNTDL